jgi:group I intron endonuclease
MEQQAMRNQPCGACKVIIYRITNLINLKIYVGQTVLTLSERWMAHKKEAKLHRKNYILYNSINKYGIENFIIEEIDIAHSLEELNKKEQEWIAKLASAHPYGYNLKLGGNGGGKHLQSTKDKISRIYKQKYENGYISPLLGRKFTKEHKSNISKARLGKKLPSFTQEHKRKLSLAHIGTSKPHSEEWKQNQKIKMTGRKFSDEVKKLMSEQHPNKRKIICLNSGQIFNSSAEAAKLYKLSSGNLSSHLKGKFKYLINKENNEKLKFSYYGDKNV